MIGFLCYLGVAVAVAWAEAGEDVEITWDSGDSSRGWGTRLFLALIWPITLFILVLVGILSLVGKIATVLTNRWES